MSPDSESPDQSLEAAEEQASVDEALSYEEAHEKRRAADHKQGEIERRTREAGLDEG